jgi:hypothetical protein
MNFMYFIHIKIFLQVILHAGTFFSLSMKKLFLMFIRGKRTYRKIKRVR